MVMITQVGSPFRYHTWLPSLPDVEQGNMVAYDGHNVIGVDFTTQHVLKLFELFLCQCLEHGKREYAKICRVAVWHPTHAKR